jgi:3-hydroxyacyl-CoA dehydrogenase
MRGARRAKQEGNGIVSYKINKVAVLGSGTMGAQIAAHCANAGLEVLLLDISPRELTKQERLEAYTESKQVRNRIVNAGSMPKEGKATSFAKARQSDHWELRRRSGKAVMLIES